MQAQGFGMELEELIRTQYRIALTKTPEIVREIVHNFRNQPLHVRHAELVRASENNLFRSLCPVCETGTLLVQRDQATLALLAGDNCISCGQPVIYDDIDDLRKLDGIPE